MRYAVALAGLLLLAFLGHSPQADASPQAPERLRVPLEPKEDMANVPYWGIVTEIAKDSLTIQFDNQKDRKPKRFPVSETLAAGKFPTESRLMPGQRAARPPSPDFMYRLTEVKVGDWVNIHYAHLGDLDICDNINIAKRPGGFVPPLPDEAEALLKPGPPLGKRGMPYIPYHEWRNAYWDLEDKGIPYPEKFGVHRRFPAAPMPREVKPQPNIAP